jgi:GNAT superfamily N-acetyltransferase
MASSTSNATAELRIVAANDAPWDDVRTVFGTRGDPARCWCQFFKVDNPTWNAQDVPAFEQALCEQQSERGAGPGVLAYLGDEPVGWCAVEPQTAYLRIVRPERGDLPAQAGTWAATCFVVRVGYRRKGVASALLAGAVEHARANGAVRVEGYPSVSEKKLSSADLYRGPRSVFEAAGFKPVPESTSRLAMRLELT